MTDSPAVRRAYDETPYPGDPLAEAQPDRLATVARLHGLAPAPPGRCRVLELGCGDGGNLRAAALAAPASEHVGLDLSGAHVEAGRAVAADVGLSNLRLVQGDLREAASLGTFDFVIAHGLFSWVPQELQGALLETIGRVLAPGGVAYVSYNTYPGWHLRGAVHEVLRRQTATCADPGARAAQARALLDLLAHEAPESEPAYRAVLEAEAEFLRSGEHDPAGLRAYLTHEVLAGHNHPVWFADFAALATTHGLAHLSDAVLHDGLDPAAASGPVRAALAATGDLALREQLADCVVNRYFRRSLLVRAGATPDRSLPAAAVKGLRVVSAARPEGDVAEDPLDPAPLTFARRGGGRLTASDPLARAALGHALARFPGAVPFGELLDLARADLAGGPPRDAAADEAALAALLLRGHLGDVLDLRVEAPACTGEVRARPLGNPLARRAARLGLPVWNAHHQRVPLEPLGLTLLPLLDGTRDVPALLDHVARLAADGALVLEGAPRGGKGALRRAVDAPVRAALRFLARAGLLLS